MLTWPLALGNLDVLAPCRTIKVTWLNLPNSLWNPQARVIHAFTVGVLDPEVAKELVGHVLMTHLRAVQRVVACTPVPMEHISGTIGSAETQGCKFEVSFEPLASDPDGAELEKMVKDLTFKLPVRMENVTAVEGGKCVKRKLVVKEHKVEFYVQRRAPADQQAADAEATEAAEVARARQEAQQAVGAVQRAKKAAAELSARKRAEVAAANSGSSEGSGASREEDPAEAMARLVVATGSGATAGNAEANGQRGGQRTRSMSVAEAAEEEAGAAAPPIKATRAGKGSKATR